MQCIIGIQQSGYFTAASLSVGQRPAYLYQGLHLPASLNDKITLAAVLIIVYPVGSGSSTIQFQEYCIFELLAIVIAVGQQNGITQTVFAYWRTSLYNC